MTKYSYDVPYGEHDNIDPDAVKRMKVIRHTATQGGIIVTSHIIPSPPPRKQGGRRPQDISVS